MHRYILSILFILSFSFPQQLLAGSHDVVTGKFTVNGVCEKCKKRIEEAAYIKGVKYADWDVDNHQLTVKYDSSKTSPDLILQSIAAVGHDAGNIKATQAAYEKLPACCHYRDGIKKH